MVEIDPKPTPRIQQGDILRDIDFIQRIEIIGNEVSIHKISFPLVIVLTQDCDLQEDSKYYVKVREAKPSNDDKKLLSVIVAPLYNEEMFLQGQHLNDETLKYTMQIINKKTKGNLTTQYKFLIRNEIPRFHHLKFKETDPIVDQVIDFKHYFTVNVEDLTNTKDDKFVCKVSQLYREHISQRFAYFLSRIGLPDMLCNGG